MKIECETAREWIALELYGELDASEHARLASHLGECSACRTARAELDRGLGAWVPSAEPAQPASSTRRAGSRAWLPAAVGFAAGVLLTLALQQWSTRPPEPARGGPSAKAARSASLARLDPPPRATSSGWAAELDAWMRD